MSLSHDEFFALAIDPDGPPDPSRLAEIEEHRRTCEECRELEQDYPRIKEIGAKIPLDVEPDDPEIEERVLKAAREVIAARGNSSGRSILPWVIGAILVGAVAGAILWQRSQSPPPADKKPVDRGEKKPVDQGEKKPVDQGDKKSDDPFKPRDPKGIDLGGH